MVPRSSGKPWHDRIKPARSVLEQVPKLRLDDAALLRRGHVHLGKLVAPMPGPAGIDDRPAVGVVAGRLALRLDARVERGRPGIADDVDRGRRIGAREHGPDQLFELDTSMSSSTTMT